MFSNSFVKFYSPRSYGNQATPPSTRPVHSESHPVRLQVLGCKASTWRVPVSWPESIHLHSTGVKFFHHIFEIPHSKRNFSGSRSRSVIVDVAFFSSLSYHPRSALSIVFMELIFRYSILEKLRRLSPESLKCQNDTVVTLTCMRAPVTQWRIGDLADQEF